MEQPYRPPTAAPPPDEDGVSVRGKRVQSAVSWLGGVAILVGVGLTVSLKRNGLFQPLERENFPASYPGFLRKLVMEVPEYPIRGGVVLALLAFVSSHSGKLTQALVLAFLAVGIIGGWTGVLMGALMHFIRSIAA